MAKILGLLGPGTLVISGTANRVAIYNADGELVSSTITTTELAALDDYTGPSTIETRLAALEADVSGFETLADGAIYIGSALNVATEVVPSGDVTISNTGVTSITAGVIVNADINASAAIAHSKMAALTASRAMTTDASGVATVSSVTDTELGYVSGVTGAIQDQIDGVTTALSDHEAETATHGISSVIVGESETQTLTNKTIDADLNTISNIENADIKVGAGVDRAKLASGTASHVLINDVSGVMSSEATLANSRGGTGTGTYATGDILYASSTNTLSKLAAGSDGEVLTLASGVPSWAAGGSGGGGEFGNLGIEATISSGIALALKQADGTTNPSTGSSAVSVQFRSATATSGAVVTRSITSTVTATINSSATLGTDLIGAREGRTSNASGARQIYLYLLDNAGTVEWAFSGSNKWDERELQTTTTAGASSTDANTLFSATGRSNVAIRLVGRLDATYNLGWSAVTRVYTGNKFPEKLNVAEFVGRNFITQGNASAEFGVGQWAAYADAAGTRPVDGTGGSPNTSIAVTNGDLSSSATVPPGGNSFFTVTKNSGSNRQGEGISCRFYVPQEYGNRRISISFPYRITGTYTAGALIVYLYDSDNSTVIDVFNGNINRATGVFTGAADLTASNNYRLIIHVAGTDTSGYVLSFDDVVVSPQEAVFGAPVTDWVSYTPTFTGFGTVTGINMFYRRVGDNLELNGYFTTGTCTATEARISLPTGLTSDSSKVPAIMGAGNFLNGASGLAGAQYCLIESGVTYLTFGTQSSTTGAFTKINGNDAANSTKYGVMARLPISSWSSNITLSNSSTFRISSFLANGTRVTGSAPTALGEYRSYLRNSNANTYTETNGAPGTSPSATNGILLYGGNAWNTADSNNEPSYYEIFVGKNKQVKLETFASTGRTGVVITDVEGWITSSSSYGITFHYDPTTGIVSVLNPRSSANTAGGVFGLTPGLSDVKDGYFDIIVSENAQAVGLVVPNSQVRVHTHDGYGSTNTKIPRFATTVENTGTAVTYATDSTNGASFTINENGIYAISFSFPATESGGVCQAGVSLNSAQLTTNVKDITAANRLCYSGFYGSLGANSQNAEHVSWTGRLSRGDVIRPHTASDVPTVNALSTFTICKVSD